MSKKRFVLDLRNNIRLHGPIVVNGHGSILEVVEFFRVAREQPLTMKLVLAAGRGGQKPKNHHRGCK